MVNVKVLGTLVAIVVGFFIVVFSSFTADRPGVQASSVNPPERIIVDPDAGGSRTEFQLAGNHLPLMVRWSNWRPEFGPAYVYAREGDLKGLLDLEAPVEKMLMVTSYDEVQRLMAQADQLQAAGVTTVGLNTENGTGMTPGDEMQTLNNSDPEVNVVARVARLATRNGFKVVWGPVRNTVDSVSDQTIKTMMEAGVTGVAIQEQKFIERQPATSRLTAVNQTRRRYLRLAEEVGLDEFAFHVQIMHQRCPDLANCVTFVEELEDIPVDSIAIWSNGPIPVDFVEAIRE